MRNTEGEVKKVVGLVNWRKGLERISVFKQNVVGEMVKMASDHGLPPVVVLRM